MKELRLLGLLLLISASLLAQSPQAPQQNTKPFVLGVIDEIYSKQLSEKRILNIYLPEGYNPDDTVTYPVIYLLDGSADEDFIHVAGLLQFYNFPWINKVPKSILVGIASVDRKRDFTFPTTIDSDKKKFPTTGHSDKFIDFIESELQPFIEKKYRCNFSRTIIGQSLGGLLTTEILLKRPHMFNKYLIISPSLWWDNGSLLKSTSNLSGKNFPFPKDVYISVGKEGPTPSEPTRIMEDDARMLSEKLKERRIKDLNVYFEYLPEEDHATIAHQAIMNGFKALYKSNQIIKTQNNMEKIQFNITIDADKKKVWNTMLEDKTYREWTKEFHPTSYYEGSWEKGSEIKFLGTDDKGKLQGMYSRIKENKPYEFISIEHLGIVKDGVVDTTSEAATKWAPSFENYYFTEKNGKTEVRVEVDIEPEYKNTFDDMWHRALKELKRICEK